jgi:hypothetical protein
VIITMPANELLSEIHNAKQRMPLILAITIVRTGRSTGKPRTNGLSQRPEPPSELPLTGCGDTDSFNFQRIYTTCAQLVL